jgi:hypothetical protein
MKGFRQLLSVPCQQTRRSVCDTITPKVAECNQRQLNLFIIY